MPLAWKLARRLKQAGSYSEFQSSIPTSHPPSVALQVGSTGLPFGSFFVGENKHWVAHAAMDMAGRHLKGVNCQIGAKR